MSDILSAFRAARETAREILYPTQYYAVTREIPQGKAFRIGPVAPYPEVWLIHPDDFARVGAEFSLYCRMVDFRTWQPSHEDITRAFLAARQGPVVALRGAESGLEAL